MRLAVGMQSGLGKHLVIISRLSEAPNPFCLPPSPPGTGRPSLLPALGSVAKCVLDLMSVKALHLLKGRQGAFLGPSSHATRNRWTTYYCLYLSMDTSMAYSSLQVTWAQKSSLPALCQKKCFHDRQTQRAHDNGSQSQAAFSPSLAGHPHHLPLAGMVGAARQEPDDEHSRHLILMSQPHLDSCGAADSLR